MNPVAMLPGNNEVGNFKNHVDNFNLFVFSGKKSFSLKLRVGFPEELISQYQYQNGFLNIYKASL